MNQSFAFYYQPMVSASLQAQGQLPRDKEADSRLMHLQSVHLQ